MPFIYDENDPINKIPPFYERIKQKFLEAIKNIKELSSYESSPPDEKESYDEDELMLLEEGFFD